MPTFKWISTIAVLGLSTIASAPAHSVPIVVHRIGAAWDLPAAADPPGGAGPPGSVRQRASIGPITVPANIFKDDANVNGVSPIASADPLVVNSDCFGNRL